MGMLRSSAPAVVPLVAVAMLLAGFSVAMEEEVVTCSGMVMMSGCVDGISIMDFSSVGEGRTPNTKVFGEAVYQIRHLHRLGGMLLYVPSGVHLTESFNLTSHMTLYLAKRTVIKANRVNSTLRYEREATERSAPLGRGGDGCWVGCQTS
ncbi:probable polygalacturonase [Rhodamnia argentea]|uniref:Probable polygalacturonase n=1 Tax=Rhodamnia argentea TaxID=178133 RepID=A0ABM3HSU1_9MYRT|nr:probable polygalacturonase [Rhodamnia argentea]